MRTLIVRRIILIIVIVPLGLVLGTNPAIGAMPVYLAGIVALAALADIAIETLRWAKAKDSGEPPPPRPTAPRPPSSPPISWTCR